MIACTMLQTVPRPAHLRGPRIVVALAVVLAVAAVVFGLLGRGRHLPPGIAMPWWLLLLTPAYLPVPIVGALLAERHAGHTVARVLLLAGLALPLSMALSGYALLGLYSDPGSVPATRWVGPIVECWFLGPPLIAGPLLLLLPDGRARSRGWGIVAAILAAGAVCGTLGMALDDPMDDLPGFHNPYGLPGLADVLQQGLLTLPLGALLGTIGLVVRSRRGTERERHALRPLVVVALPIMVAYVLCIPAGTEGVLLVVELLGSSAIALACFAAATGRGLWDLGIAPRRVVLHAALTVVAIGLAITLVLLVAGIAGEGLRISLAVAAGAGAGALAVRGVLQRAVDRLVYGDRGDPDRALRRLAESLAAAPEPSEAPRTLALAVADALAVPYVAVELAQGEGQPATIAHGAPPTHDERHEAILRHRSRQVGRLVVAPARAGEPLGRADRRLLDDLARQAGPAMAAVGLTLELERSRDEIVRAREEERRRLRDDLHDGVGPVLAALALHVDVVRRDLPDDVPSRVDDGLGGLRKGLEDVLADIRRLVYGLRPPALDDLGLVPALREHAGRLQGLGTLTITVDAPAALPDLPAAVEVAAFRIVHEALTNVARHSGARRASVRLSLNGGLAVEVADDGQGITPGTPGGVGLASMRRRAAELGGRLELDAPAAGSGVVLRAVLPLEGAAR
jgi:signal transduction histidine kinase